MEMLLEFAFLVILVDLYIFPSTEAYIRGSLELPRILVLNLLLGWTVIGWVAAFLWARYGAENIFDDPNFTVSHQRARCSQGILVPRNLRGDKN
jgi:hypothetical protein